MNLRTLTAAALVAGTSFVAPAQEAKFNGVLLELYYTQMMDSNLRLNSASHSPAYNSLVAGMNENQFLVKRAEFYFGGKVNEDISWTAMFDPNNTGSTSFGSVLHDFWATWKVTKQLSFKMGQGKFLQTWEATSVAARDIMFYDRSQMSRVLGDRRDRGIYAQYDFGDPKGFNGKVYLGFTNGMSDNGSGGKQNEVNAQKDVVARLDLATGQHKFGMYFRDGSTQLKDVGTVTGTLWTGSGVPTAAQVLDNKDRATNLGFYYFTDTPRYHFSGEAATGLLGRRFPTIFASGTNAMGREHLDQKYLSYYVQGAYKMGRHWLTARYDFMNYNSGDQWYTAYNPYTQSAVGVSRGADYSPKFTEVNVGYNYIFIPTKSSAGKLKLNYVMRSKNFLQPRAGQSGEQGGDSLVASLQVSF